MKNVLINNMKNVLLRKSSKKIFQTLNEAVTYEEAFNRVINFSNMLPANMKKLVLFTENSQEQICSMLAAWNRNACVVPVDFKSGIDEVAFVLEDTQAEAICTSRENLETTKKAIELAKIDIEVFVLEDMPKDISFKTEATEIIRDDEDLALIVYTSGTTGKPKGVMLSFLNVRMNFKAVSEAGYFFEGLRVLQMLPCHHILPLMGTIIAPLMANGTIHMPKSMSPIDISELLQKYPVDMVVSVPRFYELIHSSVKDKISKSAIAKVLFRIAGIVNSQKFSKKIFKAVHNKFGGEVKHWICGGAAMDTVVATDMKNFGIILVEGYGMTECSPIISFPRIGKVKIGSCGQALHCNEIRIVDGEVTVKGDNVTKGYYNRPEETAEQIRDGWLYTGDIGELDSEGFLKITGRRKELLVFPNGKKLNPIEIESRIQEMSFDISEVGVLFQDNLLQAIIRIKDDSFAGLSQEEITQKIRDEIILPYNRNCASYRRIISFVCTTKDLPRTRLSKLKRHELPAYLKDIASDTPKEQKAEPTSAIYKHLKEFLASQVSVAITPDAHIEMDLGLDSLGKISLHALLKENYSLDISERDFEKNSSLRALAQFVDENKGEVKASNSLKSINWSEIIKKSNSSKLPYTHLLHLGTVLLTRILMRLFYKVEIVGKENLPKSGAVILAPNHQSFLDGLYVCKGLSISRMKKTHFFAKMRESIKTGFSGWFAKHSNVIVMDMGENLVESIGNVVEVLKRNNPIMIFPEGTRTKDGEVAEFKQTFAIFAKEMNIPIIPVKISGAFEAIKNRSTFPKIGSKIRVEYKKAVTATSESYQELANKVRDIILK